MKSSRHKFLTLTTLTALVFCNLLAPIAEAKQESTDPNANVQAFQNTIEAQVYSVKKTKYYTVVEIGFSNPTNRYLEFVPKEIYLDDARGDSRPPLSLSEVESINARKPGSSIVPGVLTGALGIATLATGIFGQHSASKALGVATVASGGATILTKSLEERSKTSHELKFENNSLEGIDKLPPGLTLGGTIFFPTTKNPASVTIIAQAKNGTFEKKVFPLDLKKGKR